jgi:hypothetical protein
MTEAACSLLSLSGSITPEEVHVFAIIGTAHQHGGDMQGCHHWQLTSMAIRGHSLLQVLTGT